MNVNFKVFLDSNIVVYAQSDDGRKTEIAMTLLNDHPVISTQVINEAYNVFTKKKILSVEQARTFAHLWLETTDVEPLTSETVRKAFELSERYYLSHWDSIIVAAALLADCTNFIE